MENDEETIYDRPENPTDLIWDGAVSVGDVRVWQGASTGHPLYVVTFDESFTGGVAALLGRVIGVDSVDVRDHDEDAARKDKKEGDNAEHAGSIETKENVCMRDEQTTGGQG